MAPTTTQTRRASRSLRIWGGSSTTSDVANVAFFLYRHMIHEPGAEVPFISFAFAYNTSARELGNPELPYATLLGSMARIAHCLKCIGAADHESFRPPHQPQSPPGT